MNLEGRQTGNDIAAKNNNQRVSVIRWCGRGSTKTCYEKSDFIEDASLPVVNDESFLSSYSVVKPNKSTVNYRCSYCKKSFKWFSHWENHERTHTKEKPFECEICRKCFGRSDGLQCHKLTHITPRYLPRTGEKSDYTQANAVEYKYPPGESANVTKELVQRTKLFNCDQCNRSFFSSAGILKHTQAHKGKRYTITTLDFCSAYLFYFLHVCEILQVKIVKRYFSWLVNIVHL